MSTSEVNSLADWSHNNAQYYHMLMNKIINFEKKNCAKKITNEFLWHADVESLCKEDSDSYIVWLANKNLTF